MHANHPFFTSVNSLALCHTHKHILSWQALLVLQQFSYKDFWWCQCARSFANIRHKSSTKAFIGILLYRKFICRGPIFRCFFFSVFFAFYSFFAHMWTHANFVALICFLTLTLLHVWHLLVLWHSHRKQILCSKVNKTRRKKNPNKARPDKRSRFFKYFRILCMLEAVFFGYCFVVACPCHSSHFIVYRIGAVARLSRANKK